jgi:DNA (cytosine-5)-methyltransferase 1
MSITIGSLFAGIGGFELGLERAIPGAQTIWQVEQNEYCQRILKKHWPHAQLFDDVCEVGAHNLPPVDILCGGFPCQDISTIGKGEGLNGKKSGLWFQMFRIICELRPRIVIMENVSAILVRGLPRILGDLAGIGYDCEWQIISASQFGALHQRKRWFAVAYPTSTQAGRLELSRMEKTRRKTRPNTRSHRNQIARDLRGDGFWKEGTTEPPFYFLDYGISNRLAGLTALGNSIVPQCSQWIGEQVLASGLLDEHYIKICEASK